MKNQNMIFSHSPCKTPPTPVSAFYHNPPYTLNNGAWTETTYQPFSMKEDVLQMQQQLRFPTPPITPPRGYKTGTEFSYAQSIQESPELQNKTEQHRTQSVIMKVGHDQNPQYLPAELPYEAFAKDIKSTRIGLHEEDQLQKQYHDQQQIQLQNDTVSSGASSPNLHNDFICEWKDCGRSFESLELLAHHVTIYHAVASLTDGLYYCGWTGCQRTERGFNARYKMLVHVRTHTKEKPHQCHLCDKRFSRAENLKIHIRSHSGEKPYICTFEGCRKAYSNSSDRFKHTRTHSMEKPYVCKIPGCQKRYTDPSSLRKHVKTFKHSVQIVDFNAKVPQALIGIKSEESRFQSIKRRRQCRTCLMLTNKSSSAAAQDSFCMAMEEMCHIKATLNCYSTAAPTSTNQKPYWLEAFETKDTFHYHHSAAYQQPTNYMQLDLTAEKPLDLRVRRC